jgi:coenzyme F420-reducing hydrogenase beta subunit/Na+-translocating ferredoxin:NAD+ oxidoreductase RnfD subunit
VRTYFNRGVIKEMSKPKEYSWMTKDKLMLCTFIALLALAIITIISWWGVVAIDTMTGEEIGWPLGLALLGNVFIAVGISVGIEVMLSKVTKDSPLNVMSAAVFGLIVALSYSLGLPTMRVTEILPLLAPEAFLYVALIAIIGMVLFKKIAGLKGRKYVNPAAAAKLIVLLPFLGTLLIPKEHVPGVTDSLGMPSLAGPIGYGVTAIGNNGLSSFATYLVACFASPTATVPVDPTQNDVFSLLFLLKFHGWPGGASSLAVIIVGIALFVVARRYIKWRITASYFVTVALMSVILHFAYPGGDLMLRLMYELFIGSSIFLAFFMATDPATTPLTYMGQLIFGVGLGVLSVLIQAYMGFLGGGILALVIMNLISPKLDKIGKLKPIEGGKEPKLPKAKLFTKIKTTVCIRCGACMRVCCNKLSPILIKEARDKRNVIELMKLDADFCAGCGNCNFVCPARIDLKSNILNFPLAEEEAIALEQQFLNGTPDENIGVYTDMFSAKSSYEGQDGGVATALLVSGMEKGLFDAAIVVRRVEGYKSTSFVAENVDDIVKARGTKYMRVRMMSKLGELVAKGKRKIAVVGTACQIRAARRIQRTLLEECPDLELTIIGLFCYEEFDYNKLKEETKRLLGVDLDKAEKTQIRKGKYTVRIDGQDHSVAVKELNNAVEKGCLSCPDFTAKYADISVGSVGSEDGYSTVIVRSDAGKKLLEKLDLAKGKVKKEEITKLAIQKKKRALQNP